MTAPAAPPTPNLMPGAQPAAPVTPPPAADPATAPSPAPAPASPAPPPVPTPPAPVAAPATAPAPTPSTPSAPPAPVADVPPWGEDFDPARAWRTIQNLRSENDGLKAKASTATDAATRADTWRTTALKSKAEALAAGKFVDTETVLLHLGDLTAFASDDAIDEAKLTSRLTELATTKPFLLVPPAQQGLTPNRAQGQSGNGGPLTAAQVAAQAESQGDMKASGLAKADQLINLRAASGVK